MRLRVQQLYFYTRAIALRPSLPQCVCVCAHFDCASACKKEHVWFHNALKIVCKIVCASNKYINLTMKLNTATATTMLCFKCESLQCLHSLDKLTFSLFYYNENWGNKGSNTVKRINVCVSVCTVCPGSICQNCASVWSFDIFLYTFACFIQRTHI